LGWPSEPSTLETFLRRFALDGPRVSFVVRSVARYGALKLATEQVLSSL
jgi:hypothetical protein